MYTVPLISRSSEGVRWVNFAIRLFFTEQHTIQAEEKENEDNLTTAGMLKLSLQMTMFTDVSDQQFQAFRLY